MVRTTDYFPWRGDVVWLDLNPHRGSEQAGHRPVLVLSQSEYNRDANLAVICPITTRVKGYPFEVRIPTGLPIVGAILADQVRCIAWPEREAIFICEMPDETVEEVLQKLGTLLGISDEL